MFSSRTNFNKLFLFHIIKLIKKAVTLRNSLCYSFYFFVQHLLKLNKTGRKSDFAWLKDSNTTLVKVKLLNLVYALCICLRSNTTLVKVKWRNVGKSTSTICGSNTTLVKVKFNIG